MASWIRGFRWGKAVGSKITGFRKPNVTGLAISSERRISTGLFRPAADDKKRSPAPLAGTECRRYRRKRQRPTASPPRRATAPAASRHLDVMDGHFVPNLTIGPPVVASIRKVTRLTLDVHLMIADPDNYAPMFIDAGADQVSVHQEACKHLDGTLREIQQIGRASCRERV